MGLILWNILECIQYWTQVEHGCTKCVDNHTFIYNSSNCITNNYVINNDYYFNNTFLKYVKCDNSCINYEETASNCKQCNYIDGYYPIEGKTESRGYNNETINEGYFLNKIYWTL